MDRAADALAPNVRRFSLELVKELKPRPVTRDLDWGVRVPVPGYDERDDKRIYVWIDAVVGYLSAAVEWADEHAAARTPGATGGRTLTRATTTSWARTTSSFTASSGPRSCSATAREARSEQGVESSSCRTTSSAASS